MDSCEEIAGKLCAADGCHICQDPQEQALCTIASHFAAALQVERDMKRDIIQAFERTMGAIADAAGYITGYERDLDPVRLVELIASRRKAHDELEALKGASSPNAALLERTAQLQAHRACCGTEHDPLNGKLHGLCVVCGVDWPCEYAGTPPSHGGG